MDKKDYPSHIKIKKLPTYQPKKEKHYDPFWKFKENQRQEQQLNRAAKKLRKLLPNTMKNLK